MCEMNGNKPALPSEYAHTSGHEAAQSAQQPLTVRAHDHRASPSPLKPSQRALEALEEHNGDECERCVEPDARGKVLQDPRPLRHTSGSRLRRAFPGLDRPKVAVPGTLIPVTDQPASTGRYQIDERLGLRMDAAQRFRGSTALRLALSTPPATVATCEEQSSNLSHSGSKVLRSHL